MPRLLFAGFAGVVLLVLAHCNASDGDVHLYILDVVSLPCDVHTLSVLRRVAYRPLTLLGLERVMLRVLPHPEGRTPIEWSDEKEQSALSLCAGADAHAVGTMEWSESGGFRWSRRVVPVSTDDVASTLRAFDASSAHDPRVLPRVRNALGCLSTTPFRPGRFVAPFSVASIVKQVDSIGLKRSTDELVVLLPDMTGVVDETRPPLRHDQVAASAVRYATRVARRSLRRSLDAVLSAEPRDAATPFTAGLPDALLILAKLGAYAPDVGIEVVRQVAPSCQEALALV